MRRVGGRRSYSSSEGVFFTQNRCSKEFLQLAMSGARGRRKVCEGEGAVGSARAMVKSGARG